MTAKRTCILVLFVFLVALTEYSFCDENEQSQETKSVNSEGENAKEQDLEYAKGSLCGYCDYCKVF